MKRRNWFLLVLVTVGLTAFILSRTVWGPPSKAAAAEVAPVETEEEASDAKRRYLTNQPRHWRYVVQKH